jgi:hypothetical protein
MDENQEGKFAAVPNEMIEILMRMDLSGSEFRLIWYFVRELQGWQMIEKIIKTGKIIKDTGLSKQLAIPALSSLVTKGVIQRLTTPEYGVYGYRFNEDNFGRVHATKRVRKDKKFLRLVKNDGQENLTEESRKLDRAVKKTGPCGQENLTSSLPETLQPSDIINEFLPDFPLNTVLKKDSKKDLKRQVMGNQLNQLEKGNVTNVPRGGEVDWVNPEPTPEELDRRKVAQLKALQEYEKGRLQHEH